MTTALKRTTLFDFHVARKAKMVPFAGWEMPVLYGGAKGGVFNEHIATRKEAGLFDVSHMAQIRFYGADRLKFLEWVTPADMQALPIGKGRLSVILNENGGVKDDCIFNRWADHVYAVVNAGCADSDIAHFTAKLKEFKGDVTMKVEQDFSLLALQGPQAAAVLGQYVPDLHKLDFLNGRTATIKGFNVVITRCGYTGEDGFEISVPHANAVEFAELLTSNPAVNLIGLGARDSLRLEAGLCLYGHELNEVQDGKPLTPVHAGLNWLITKRRWTEGGFIGAEYVKKCKEGMETDLVPVRRVGVISTGSCAREGAEIQSADGAKIGHITSGCPSPSLEGKNVAQAYVKREFAKVGTPLKIVVRGRQVSGEVAKLPFVPTHYFKATA